jgi:hypothetical protein
VKAIKKYGQALVISPGKHSQIQLEPVPEDE